MHLINFLEGGKDMSDNKISRRDILKFGTTGALGIAGSIYLDKVAPFSRVVKAEESFIKSQKSFWKSHNYA